MFSSKPTQTRGQTFAAEQAAAIARRTARITAEVAPQFVLDLHTKIDQDRRKDIQQKVFVYNITDILGDATLYSKGYFAKAVESSQLSLYPEEFYILINAVNESAKNQDFNVSSSNGNQTVIVDFTNVATLAEERIAAEKKAAEEAEIARKKAAEDAEIAKKAAETAAAEAAKLKAVADKIAQ